MKEMIAQLVRKISCNKKAIETYQLGSGSYYICAWRLEQAAGNHAFDDHYEDFGITEDDGHKIRAFFQGMHSSPLEFRTMVDSWIDEALEPISRKKG